MDSANDHRHQYKISQKAKSTSNPIRNIVDVMHLEPNPEEEVISLALGDPSVHGNLDPPLEVTRALQEALQSEPRLSNGYGPQIGQPRARQAVADYLNRLYGMNMAAEDVVLTSGCSGALLMVMELLLDEGDAVLLPRPGFSLYKTIADSMHLRPIFYDLLDQANWQVDLDQLESLINESGARVWLLNNPSNPCGSVFSREHLLACLHLAAKHRLTIIADEIYEGMTFGTIPFIPLASLLDADPAFEDICVLTCGGIAKCFCVPGWRVGWILGPSPPRLCSPNSGHEDVQGYVKDSRQGLVDLAGLILGANTVVQAALPSILLADASDWKHRVMQHFRSNADLVMRKLKAVPGLTPIASQGAMYMMIKMEQLLGRFPSDIVFIERLMAEESVMCLPGRIFGAPHYIRIVLCPPTPLVEEAIDRLVLFCRRHA